MRVLSAHLSSCARTGVLHYSHSAKVDFSCVVLIISDNSQKCYYFIFLDRPIIPYGL